jgi:glycosyltransferase involved in cell wall biosynthesis
MAGDIISDTVHNNCGLSADGKTYKEIEKNLLINTKKLIQDNDLRIELSKNGRKILEEKYTWEKLTININKIYEGIVNEK